MALTIIRALVDPMAHVQSIAIPGFHRFLSVAMVLGDSMDRDGARQPQPAVFALGDLDQPVMAFSLRVFHTGNHIPDAMLPTLEFIGTAASREGRIACHIFLMMRPFGTAGAAGTDV